MTIAEITYRPYASISRRFLAFVLDAIILAIPCGIGSHIVPVIGGIAIWFFYAPMLESSEIRATLGKHLCGIQVTDLQGGRITLRSAVIRSGLKVVSSAMLFIGFFFALFTKKKQTLHDLLADTIVVHGTSEQSIADAWVANIKEVFQSKPVTEASGALSQLERLQSLRDRGALTEDEFQDQKQRILSRQL